MVLLEDQIHIRQVLDGNPSAYAHLVQRYKKLVYNVVLRIVRQKEDAEEIAQDAFIKAFDKLDTFEGNSKFSTWICSIAYRLALNKLRKRKEVMVEVETVSLPTETGSEFEPLQDLSKIDQKKYVQQAIAMLPELESVAITLFYMEDLSTKEIAEVMELSEANVRVKLHRARKSLKEKLQQILSYESENLL